MKQLLLTAIAVAGLALSANAANAQNLVKNGDFEQSAHGAPEGFINLGVAQSYGQAGDITDWTIGGGESKLSLYMNNANATTVGASTGGKFTLPTSFLDVANLPGDTLATGAV